MTSQSAPFPVPDNAVSGKQNGLIAGNDNNNSSATCILDPSSRLAISIALPDAEAVIEWKCKASTTFGEVIKQVCAEHGLDASFHVLVNDNEDDDAVYVEGSECRSSNLVGLNKRRQFLLLPRTHLVKDPYSYKTMREKKTSVTTVEMTNRVLVHLPQQKRVVIRISLKESVKSVFDRVCSEKQLYPPDFVVCRPDTREPLDMNKSLADYNIMEMLIEKISGPCESQTLPRRSGAGARAMLPSRVKAKSASKATGANVFNEDISHSRGAYHGSSVSLAVDGVHGERRTKKPSKINAFLTFLKIKKKKKPRKDEIDGSIENLSASPSSSPARGRPNLLSGGRPVSAFIPPDSLPVQRPMKKRRAPAPPSKPGRLSGEEEEGRLKAQAAVPGLSQSVPALPSLVPVQVDIEVDETSQPPPEDDKRRRRRAAPRPPTPPQEVEDARRAPPNFVAPPPPEEPPPADIPVTRKPYHEDKAVDAAGVGELAMELTGTTANVQIPRRADHKLSINDNRRKSRMKDGLSLGAEVNVGSSLTKQPQVNNGDIPSVQDGNEKELSIAPVLHVDKPSVQPELGVVGPQINKVGLSLEANLNNDVATSLPQVIDKKAVEPDMDRNYDVPLKGDAYGMEPELGVNKSPLPPTRMKIKLSGDSSSDHELNLNKPASRKIGIRLNGDSSLEPELDVSEPPSPHAHMEMNGGSSLEPELVVSEPPSPHTEMNLRGGLSLETNLSKDELLLPGFQSEMAKSTDEHPDELSLVEMVEMNAGKDIDMNAKRKIHVRSLNCGADDEDSSLSETEDEDEEEEELVKEDRKVAVIFMSSESRIFEDINGSNFEEKCPSDPVSTLTGEDGEKPEFRELICQETAAALVNSVIASAVVQYTAWNDRSGKMAEILSEEGDKSESESKSTVYKTFVVQDEEQKPKRDISITGDEDRENRVSGSLEDHHFDTEMEKILSEDQEVHLNTDNVFEEKTSDEYSEDEIHQELKLKREFCMPHQEEREEVFFTPADDAHPQLLQFSASQEGDDLFPHSNALGDNNLPSEHLHQEASSREFNIEVSLENHKSHDSPVVSVVGGELGSHDIEGFAVVDEIEASLTDHNAEGSVAVSGSLTADHGVTGSAAVNENLTTDRALDGELEEQVFDTSLSDVMRKTENARSRCHELAFDPEAAEEDEQMEVKLVTPVCSPVKLEEVRTSSPTSSSTPILHTDNDLSVSDTSSFAHRSASPAWSAGSGGPRSIFLKAIEKPGSANPVIESLEQQVEHWKDQLVLNRKRLEDSDSGGSHGQENLMQEQIKLQQALVAQMEKNITSLRARSSSSEMTSSSSACPSSKSVASDQPSNVAPAHVAPKITRQRDQHRDAAKPIFDSKVHVPQFSARAARMAARAERRSESAKSDEM